MFGRGTEPKKDSEMRLRNLFVLVGLVIQVLCGCGSESAVPRSQSVPTVISPTAPPTTPQPTSVDRVLLKGPFTMVADANWSDQECNQLRTLIAKIYPKLVDIYGKPSEKGTVVVERTDNEALNLQFIPQDGKNIPQVESFRLPKDIINYPSTMAHELAHRFHGRWTINFSHIPAGKNPNRHSAIEEGMATAVAQIIANKLKLTDKPSDNSLFKGEQQLNKPSIRFRGTLFTEHPLYGVRKNMASWAFERWEARHPGFLKRFNAGIYQKSQPIVYDDCWELAEKISPGARSWFTSQEIFNPRIKAGPFLNVIGTPLGVAIVLLESNADGNERQLPYEPVEIVHNGAKAGPMFTDPGGKIRFPCNPTGTIKVRWRDLVDSYTYR